MISIYSIITGAINLLKRRGGFATLKTHTLYSRALDGNSTVVDLGANVGEFAALIADRFGVVCHAVEAIPSLLDQIPCNPRIHRYGLAIMDRDGPVQFFRSENPECNSIHKPIAQSFGLGESVLCNGTTFSSFLTSAGISHVSLLKVDIEGAEELLFNSTPTDVLRQIDQITVEFHDFIPGSTTHAAVSEIIRKLQSIGFCCLPFSYVYPDMPHADLLFLRLSACRVGIRDRAYIFLITSLLKIERVKSRLRRWG